MRIEQADTYKYEMKHFGKLLDQGHGEDGACYKNVKTFCKEYKDMGRNVSVSLVVGIRTWCDDEATYGYHYLVKDDDTGEFADPQYWRFTFIELHNWSLEDYIKESDEYEKASGQHHLNEFFAWCCTDGFEKTIENALKLIKSLSNYKVRLSNKTIEQYCREQYSECPPTYGKRVITRLILD